MPARLTAAGSSEAKDVTLVVGDELYFEEGELGSAFNPRQTPEEAKAGF